MHFLKVFLLCFVFYFCFCFSFVPCHCCYCYLICYIALYLALLLFGWYVVSHLALLLLTVVHHPCLMVLLMFVVVRHPSFWVVVVCYGALPSPCNVHCCCYLLCFIVPHLVLLLFVVVHCPSPCIVACVVCCPSPCALLVAMVHCLHIVLLLFAMVHHPSPCVIACCGSSPSPCVVKFCCGLSSLTLCHHCLLWCITLVLHCCYSMWFVAPRFTLLLCRSMPFPSIHLTFPCVVFVICYGLFLALCCCLLVEVMYFPPLLSCACSKA